MLGVASALVVYFGSYIMLSSRGCYVPGSVGLGFVKWYNWAPQGFAFGPAATKQNRPLKLFYFPLWIMDLKFVHTAERAYTGQYPINTLLDAELQKITQDWNKKKAVEWAELNQQGGSTGKQSVGTDTNFGLSAAGSRR